MYSFVHGRFLLSYICEICSCWIPLINFKNTLFMIYHKYRYISGLQYISHWVNVFCWYGHQHVNGTNIFRLRELTIFSGSGSKEWLSLALVQEHMVVNDWQVCAKTSNCSLFLCDDCNLRLLPYRGLLSRLANSTFFFLSQSEHGPSDLSISVHVTSVCPWFLEASCAGHGSCT